MACRSIGRFLSILNRQAQMYLNAALKDLDIGSSEHIFLINLLKEDGITQEELSARIFIDKAATARAIKSLEEKGYVRREADSHDKRVKKVFATEKAEACGSEIHQVLKDWTALITEDMDEDAVNGALDVLERMSEKARRTDYKKKVRRE